MPLVSVCIPSYNHEKYIGELIQSVLDQTLTDFELIICDDKSSDNTPSVIESFKDSRIQKYFNKENLGVAANINKVLSIARGKYVVGIGSDDLMLPDNLRRKVEVLEKNPQVGFVYSDYIEINEKGNSTGRKRPRNPDHDCVISNEVCFIRLMQEGNFIAASSVMTRKECFDRLGLYDERLRSNQDYEMWLRISLQYDCAYLSEPLIKYRWHATNITHDYLNENSLAGSLQDCLCKEIAMGHFRRVKANFLSKENLSAIYENIGRHYLWINETQKARILLFNSLRYRILKFTNWRLFFISLFPKFILMNLKKIIAKTIKVSQKLQAAK